MPRIRGSASVPRNVITMNPGFLVVTPTAVAAPTATRPQAVRPARYMSILLEEVNGMCTTVAPRCEPRVNVARRSGACYGSVRGDDRLAEQRVHQLGCLEIHHVSRVGNRDEA